MTAPNTHPLWNQHIGPQFHLSIVKKGYVTIFEGKRRRKVSTRIEKHMLDKHWQAK